MLHWHNWSRGVRTLSKILGLWRDDSPSLLLLGRLAGAAVSLCSAPLVARLIGPDGRGITAATIAVYYVVPILLAFGVPTYVRRRVAISRSVKVITRARGFALASIVPSALAAWAAYHTVFATITGIDRVVASAGVLVAPFVISWTCDVSVLVAQGRFRSIFALLVTPPLGNLLLVLLFWGGGVVSTSTVILANVISNVATCLLGFVLVRPGSKNDHDLPSMWGVVSASIPYSGAAIADAALNRVDQVVMLPLIGAYQSGLYAVAVTLSALPAPVGSALGSAYFGRMARVDDSEARSLSARVLKSGFLLSLITVIPIALVTPLAISVLFGEDFMPAVPVAFVSYFGSVFVVLGFICANILAARGRGLGMTVAQVLAVVCALGLLVLLAPSLGAWGAALASSAGYGVSVLIMVYLIRPDLKALRIRGVDFRHAVRDLLKRQDDS